MSAGSRDLRTSQRRRRRLHEGQALGYTKAQLEALRKEVVDRRRVERIATRAHRGALDHGVPDDIVISTVNDAQVVLVSKNGNWVFYKNGTVVVTRAAQPDDVLTAFGRGGSIPQRRLEDLRRLHGRPELGLGDPEPPVRLADYIAQQSGDFQVVKVWP